MKQNVSTQYSSNDFLVLENKAIYFAKENDCIDCVEIAKITDTEHIYVSWFGILLTGSTESTNNPLFFGELDKNGDFIESKPIYQLINKVDSSNIESNNTKVYNDKTDFNSIESKTHNKESSNTLSTLNIFLGSSSLTILNYSLLDSSLNIKLECKSKESKEILDKEKQAKEAIESKEILEREKITIKKDSSLTAQNDNSTSTAFLHPILEDNELKCPHNGVVKLKSVKGKAFKSNNIPMILESDLINSPIIGCTNNIAGVPTPCSMIATILPNARALKKYNNDYPIMQDLVASGVMSDKGFPIICTPKPNKFKINAPKPTHANNNTKDTIASQITYHKPTFTICYKIDSLQKNSLNIYQCKINNKEIKSNTILQEYELNLEECKNPNNNNLPIGIQNNYKDKDFAYKIFHIIFDNHTREYIFIIPKKIPKIINQAYKDNKEAQQNKDYGYGTFKLIDDTHKEYKQENIFSKEVWLIPSCCKKLMIKFGNEDRKDTQSYYNSYNALSNIYVR